MAFITNLRTTFNITQKQAAAFNLTDSLRYTANLLIYLAFAVNIYHLICVLVLHEELRYFYMYYQYA